MIKIYKRTNWEYYRLNGVWRYPKKDTLFSIGGDLHAGEIRNLLNLLEQMGLYDEIRQENDDD